MAPASFQECELLHTVDLSLTSLWFIEARTFAHCSQLQLVTLPHELQAIHKEAFFNCQKLVWFDFPPSLHSIDKRAFAGCTCLCTLTKLLPLTSELEQNPPARYAEDAFNGCVKLQKSMASMAHLSHWTTMHL